MERASGSSDLPIQPYLVFDSRLSGTSHHGVLWMGGSYEEETGWTPVMAQLISNNNAESEIGPLPRTVHPRPRRRLRRRVLDGPDCRPSDTDVSSTVVVVGEMVADETGDLTVERTYRTMDLELFYFNNTVDGQGNCDREPPVIGEGPHHSVADDRVDWAVPVSDPDGDGVWRVVAVYNDEAKKIWVPEELADDDGDGTWTGSITMDPGILTYFVQAVDNRGNVAWLEFDGAPMSGVELGLALPEQVEILPPPTSWGLIFADGFEDGTTTAW